MIFSQKIGLAKVQKKLHPIGCSLSNGVNSYFQDGLFLSLARGCFAIGIFLLPFRLRSLIYAGNSYELGFFNEYVAFFIHVSELFFLLALLLLGIAFLTQRVDIEMPREKFLLPFILVIAVSGAMIPFASDPFLALLHLWRVVQFVLLAFLIIVKVFDIQSVLKVFLIAMFFQAMLAIAQFFARGEMGIHFFGESLFTVETFNVAKTVLPSGEVLVRGMGMLPHANILGGLAAITLLLFSKFSQKNILTYFLAVVIMAGMFFSFSRAAFLAFFIGLAILLLFQFRRRIISAFAATSVFVILLASFGSPFLVRFQAAAGNPSRLEQVAQTMEIAQENIVGVGRGSYTAALAAQEPDLEFWQLQPVHNFFALKMGEESVLTALVWLCLFVLLAWWCLRKKKYEALAVLAGIFTLMNFDHYFSTNFTAEAALWLAFAFVVSELGEGKPRFSRRLIRKSS